jgi:lipid II isoglutaminyl synthase (glutamine-hydrolysing)
VSARGEPDPTSRHRRSRTSLAMAAVTATNRLSRALGRGSGTVVGGRAGLLVDPALLGALASERTIALVSGTNGKTTTTTLLAAAVDGPTGVASNDTGANMPAGHVAALVAAPHASVAVLEVDEGYLGQLIEEARPRVIVLLNLSRDQLDRIAEVRMLVDRWRTALAALPAPGSGEQVTVVANADDPMVAWAALAAPRVSWVGAGQVWHDDAVGCPACGGRIAFPADSRWSCERCGFCRPDPEAWLDGEDLVLADGSRHALRIGLPGRFNRANAAMVAVAALSLLAGAGTEGTAQTLDDVLTRVSAVTEVAGRFSTVHRRGRPVRLLLAKNPAGWTAIFDLLDETGDATAPLVLSVNARVVDGLDPSWLWDVPFERLARRTVLATGDRRLDLAVRLRYAEVAHEVVARPLEAIDHALAGTETASVEFLGNYTAFADIRRAL